MTLWIMLFYGFMVMPFGVFYGTIVPIPWALVPLALLAVPSVRTTWRTWVLSSAIVVVPLCVLSSVFWSGSSRVHMVVAGHVLGSAWVIYAIGSAMSTRQANEWRPLLSLTPLVLVVAAGVAVLYGETRWHWAYVTLCLVALGGSWWLYGWSFVHILWRIDMERCAAAQSGEKLASVEVTQERSSEGA